MWIYTKTAGGTRSQRRGGLCRHLILGDRRRPNLHVATNTPRSTDSQGRSHCEKSDEVRLHVLSHVNHLYKFYNILNTKLTMTMPNPNHCWWKHSLRKWLNLVHFFLDKQSIFIYVLLTKARSSTITHILTMRESTNNLFISVSPRGQLMRPDCSCCLSSIFLSILSSIEFSRQMMNK